MTRTRLTMLVLAALLVAPACAGAQGFPQEIALPDDFQPEGIARGQGQTLFVGSIPTGAVWAANARTGEGAVRVPPHDGRAAIGIKVDRRRDRIFVAGGPTGDAYVYDADTGADVASWELAPDGAETFVNDVVLTRRAAFFTDSRLQQLYVVPLGRGGALPGQDEVRTVPLTGDIAYTTGNNANGIVAYRGGRRLIVVQGNTGQLFRVNPRNGRTREISLGGDDVMNGDGMLLRGRTLYVVQNRLNQIARIRLDRRRRSGEVRELIRDPDFDVPSTITFKSGFLWAVNARFGTATEQDNSYSIVRVG